MYKQQSAILQEAILIRTISQLVEYEIGEYEATNKEAAPSKKSTYKYLKAFCSI